MSRARFDREKLIARLGTFWTFPNTLSLMRAVLVLPITYLIVVDGSIRWIVGLILLAAFTDWVDGQLARWSHTVSEWGKVLDPLADKFAAVMVVPALVFRAAEPTLPLWLLLVVVGRDVCIVAGGILIARRTGRIAVSTWAGKGAVAALSLTVLAAILKADPPVLQFCVWLTAGLMVLSFVVYTTRLIRILRVTQHRPPPSGTMETAASASDAAETEAMEEEEPAKSVRS